MTRTTKTPAKSSARDVAIESVKVAAYHNDRRAAMRLFVETRISWATYCEAWEKGQLAKRAGVACTCPDCQTIEHQCQLCGMTFIGSGGFCDVCREEYRATAPKLGEVRP